MPRVKLVHVVGTRPNFMKVAPVMAAVERWNACLDGSAGCCFDQVLVHTGQHYDDDMSSIFFRDLGMRAPDVFLDVRSGTHAGQTARLMTALEEMFAEARPNLVLVVGDVNTTLAAALVAVKEHIAVAHVESGLRSGDRCMPEEINRIVTDRVSRLLFTTSAAASRRLVNEGVDPSWISMVGNTMIDCLEQTLPLARRRAVAESVGLEHRGFALVTLHRPSNVDSDAQLARLVEVLLKTAERVPVAFPVHARTAARLRTTGLVKPLQSCNSVLLLPPLGYVDFLSLLSDARLVLTDSGGIQAETCVVGTPCITARATTEWTETVDAGINSLVNPFDADALLQAVDLLLARSVPLSGMRPELWDGHAAERIVAVIADWAKGKPNCP